MKNKICCIYLIVNKVNGKFYLGSTEDFIKRVKRHKKELTNNKHHNVYLQRAYNKHGLENFSFIIKEKCSPNNRTKKEQKYLNNLPDYKKCYNVSGSATGGNLIKNHPRREQIIKERTDFLVKMNKDPNRKKVDFKGSKNPNYGNKWSDALRKKVSKIRKEQYKNWSEERKQQFKETTKKSMKKFYQTEAGDKLREKWSKERTGRKNSFYGKKHSKQTKMLISQKNKGRINPKRIKVEIEGVIYDSLDQAAKELNMHITTVSYRLKSTNPKFKNWNQIGKLKQVKELESYWAKKLRLEGKIYKSATEAARVYGLSITAILFRVRSKNPKWKEFQWA